MGLDAFAQSLCMPRSNSHSTGNNGLLGPNTQCTCNFDYYQVSIVSPHPSIRGLFTHWRLQTNGNPSCTACFGAFSLASSATQIGIANDGTNLVIWSAVDCLVVCTHRSCVLPWKFRQRHGWLGERFGAVPFLSLSCTGIRLQWKLDFVAAHLSRHDRLVVQLPAVRHVLGLGLQCHEGHWPDAHFPLDDLQGVCAQVPGHGSRRRANQSAVRC